MDETEYDRLIRMDREHLILEQHLAEVLHNHIDGLSHDLAMDIVRGVGVEGSLDTFMADIRKIVDRAIQKYMNVGKDVSDPNGGTYN